MRESLHSSHRRPLRRPSLRGSVTALTVFTSAAALVLLAGCATDDGAGAPSNDPSTPSASTEPSTDPGAEPSAEPTPEADPFTVECVDLLSLDDVYAYNANYGEDPDFSAEGTVADVLDDNGTACGWLNQTSGDTFSVAVATPTTDGLESRKNDAALASKPVPTYGTPPDVDGYFTTSDGVGEAEVFTGDYWIVVRGENLLEPGDAEQLVGFVLENLP